MEDVNNKKMMAIINRRRRLSSEYLKDNPQGEPLSSTSKPKLIRDTTVKNVASSTIIHLNGAIPSSSSKKEPKFHLQILVSPSNIHSSSMHCSDQSTPEIIPKPGPRWWQKYSSLYNNVKMKETFDHKEYNTSSQSQSTTCSTGWNSQVADAKQGHSKLNKGNVPPFDQASLSNTISERRNSQGIIKTLESSRVYERKFPLHDEVKSLEIRKGLNNLNVQENLKIKNFCNASSLQHTSPIIRSRPKVDDRKFSLRDRSALSNKAHKAQQIYIVPPPRQRVPISEYYVGELVIIRKNRHAWLLASIRNLSSRGLKVWVQESLVFVNIPLELLYTHLRKIDDDLLKLFPGYVYKVSKKNENHRVFLNDKDLQQHGKSLSTISSSSLCLVNLVRPTHLAHRRLYQPPKIISCIICYEGMSTMEAHFPWDCNHGSHLHCLEIKLQHSLFGSVITTHCPTCKDNKANNQKSKLVQNSFVPSLDRSNSIASFEEIHQIGIKADHDIKFNDINRERCNQPSSKSTTFGTDTNFNVSNWRAIRCSCGFNGIARKNVQLGMPPVCPACLDPVAISWIPSEKDLIKTLSLESPPRRQMSQLVVAPTEVALLSPTPNKLTVDQKRYDVEKDIRPSKDGLVCGNISYMPSIKEMAGRQAVCQYKDVDSYINKHPSSTSSLLVKPLEKKEQSSPCSKELPNQWSKSLGDFLTKRTMEPEISDKPITSDDTKENTVLTNQIPSQTTTISKSASKDIQPDVDNFRALAMPVWNSRGTEMAIFPINSSTQSTHLKQTMEEQTMEELDTREKTSVPIKINNKSLSTQPIIDEDMIEKRLDVGLLIEGHTNKSEETYPTTSRKAFGPMDMHRPSLRQKQKTTLPTDSLGFYIIPSNIKQKMEKMEVGGKTLRSIEINNKTLSTQSILEEEEPNDKVLDVGFLSTGNTENSVQTQSSVSITDLGTLDMPQWSLQGKGKTVMPKDSLDFCTAPLYIKQRREESELGGETHTIAKMNNKPISTQSIIENNSKHKIIDKNVSENLHKENLYDKPNTSKDIKEENVFANKPSSKIFSQEDADVGSQHNLTFLGALGMPRYSSRAKGKATLPVDSLALYITPSDIKQRMRELGLKESTLTSIEMDDILLSNQSIKEEETYVQLKSDVSTQSMQCSTIKDPPRVGNTKRIKEVESLMSTNFDFGSLINTIPEEDMFGEFISTPTRTEFHPIPTTSRDSKLPSNYVYAYSTENKTNKKEHEVHNKTDPHDNGVSPLVEPRGKPKSKPSELGSGLGIRRSKAHALPIDSLSIYITPFQIKQQLEILDKWSGDLDSTKILVGKGKSPITIDEEKEDMIHKQPSPPFQISSFQTSVPHVQPTNSSQIEKLSGRPKSRKQELPTDSLSFYITPTLVKQQMAQLQELQEDKDVDIQDYSQVPSISARAEDNSIGTQSQMGDSTLSFLQLLAPLRVIPEDAAISTDDSSTPSSSDVAKIESQPSSSKPTSLATRLKRMKLRKSKSAPSTPSTNPAPKSTRATSWSAPSTPTEEIDNMCGLENDPNIQWINVRWK